MTTTDWMPELADDDLDVLMDALMDALEAWEQKDLAGEVMGSLMDSMMTRGDPLARAEAMMQREAQQAERNRDKRLRKERSVLLRAKLLTLRDRRRAEHMTSEALR